MKADSIVSKTTLEGNTFYRIHDVVEGTLTNIRCVKEVGEELLVLNNAKMIDGLSDWLNNSEDITQVEEMEAARILKFLSEYQGVILANFAKIMNATDNGGEVLNGISVGGELFGFVGNTPGKGLIRVYQLIGGETGKVAYFGVVNKEHHMERLVQWFFQDEDAHEMVFQISDTEFVGIRDFEDKKAVVSLRFEEKEGKNYFVGGPEQIVLYNKDEEDEWKRIADPELSEKDMVPLLNGVIADMQETFGFTLL